MSFPARILDYLHEAYYAKSRPCCLLLKRDLSLISISGNAAHYGLDEVTPGMDMSVHAPYLVGMPLDAQHELPFVNIGDGVSTHIHFLPDGDHCYVVLLDASEEHEQRFKEQQAKNEARLLQVNQQKLIARQRDLISELVEAKAELDHRRRDVERSSASKSRFIAMMSHEFRTPLASIINYAELALEDDVGERDRQKSLEAILRSGRHMNSMVDAVLDEARIEAGQIQLSERDFSLPDMLDDLAAIIAPLAAEKSLSFGAFLDEDVPAEIHADDVCLRQVLVNLLGNAVKFTEEGSIRLDVSFLDGRLVASVSDTGPGISAEDQERVFQAFERGEGTQGSQRGAGLGLAITLGLVKLMGGEVSLDSAPGKGCTVTVHVPIRAADNVAQETEPVLPSPKRKNMASQRASVLVCDDDADMIALVEFYLHRAGYGLLLASNGEEVVEKALDYRPDLVLMDVNMPKQSGVEAARELRKKGYSAPIVALTAGNLSDQDKDSFTAAFRKPVVMQELLGHIKELTHKAIA